MKKNLDDPLVTRILRAFNFTTISELCKLTGKSSQNMNGIINRGKLYRLVEADLVKLNVNTEWVRTGRGEITKIQPLSAGADDLKDKYIISLEKTVALLEEELNQYKSEKSQNTTGINKTGKHKAALDAKAM